MLAIVVLLGFTGGSALPAQTALRSMVMLGTIGPYRVGVNYTVRDNTELVAAHYFYVSQGKDIALTGKAGDGGVEWKGADGSAFHLRFVGNASSEKGKELTFYTSVGLRGTWVLGEKTLPVTLEGGYSTANPGQRMYADVTDEPDAAFEAKVEAFRKAVLAGDKAAAMTFVGFPLEVDEGETTRSCGERGAAAGTVGARVYARSAGEAEAGPNARVVCTERDGDAGERGALV